MDNTAIVEMAKLTSEMIKIPSVTKDSEKLAEIAEFIRGWLDGRGLSAKIVEFKEGWPVVIAEAGRGKKSLMLNGHMDVVPEAERSRWRGDPYSGKIDGHRVFGRGAVDMKGGLAVQMYTLAEVADELDFKVVFSAVPDEETGGFNGAKLVSDTYSPNLVLVGEPGEKFIVLGEKGLFNVKLTGRGKLAHASLPSLGKNAIMYVARDLERLSDISKSKVTVPKEVQPLLEAGMRAVNNDVGIITYNPGTIVGGAKTNVVPDHCEAVIDMRIPPGLSVAGAFKIVKSMVKETDAEVVLSSEPSYTKPDIPAVRSFTHTVRKYVPSAKQIIKNAASDGRHFRYKGIPVVAYGPGDNKRAHGYNEYVTFEEISTAYKVYKDFLLNAQL